MSNQKTAVVVLSDPSTNGEEALGRLFNALAATYDYKQAQREVTLLFLGTGTRWLAQVAEPAHPAHELFEAVKDTVAGASRGCAAVFGATDEVERSGFPFLQENAVPGTPGLPSLRSLIEDGYTVLTF